MSIAQEAIGRWPSILTALGIHEDFLKRRHGPCPHCGGTDRYRFEDRAGRGTYYCNQCGPGDGWNLLKKVHGWDFATAAREVEQIIGVCPVEEKRDTVDYKSRQEYIRKIWKEAASGNIVEEYLNSRGLSGPYPKSLRGHPRLQLREEGKTVGIYPAMIALVWKNGKVVGVHRTYLLGNGEKKRKMLKCAESVSGGAVELHQPKETKEGKVLAVAEGIETALAASVVGGGIPAWALLSEGNMANWRPPEDVKRVSIFGDNDKSFAGQASAYGLAKSLTIKGCQCHVHIPHEVGDFLDVLSQTRRAA